MKFDSASGYNFIELVFSTFDEINDIRVMGPFDNWEHGIEMTLRSQEGLHYHYVCNVPLMEQENTNHILFKFYLNGLWMTSPCYGLDYSQGYENNILYYVPMEREDTPTLVKAETNEKGNKGLFDRPQDSLCGINFFPGRQMEILNFKNLKNKLKTGPMPFSKNPKQTCSVPKTNTFAPLLNKLKGKLVTLFAPSCCFKKRERS